MKVFVQVAMLLIGSSAFSAETVFDISLGEPLSMSECKKTSIGYELSPMNICWKRVFDKEATGPIVNGSVMVVFPFGESPAIVASGQMMVQILDGRIEGIGFNTLGVTNQREVLSALTAKYGEPAAHETTTASNRLGASFEAFSAAWSTPAVDVTFQSVTRTLDSGLVNIDTKKGSAWRKQALEALNKNRRSL